MFVRLRWFFLGALSALGGSAYVLSKLVRMRARLSPANLKRAGALALADALGAVGRAVAPESRGEAGG